MTCCGKEVATAFCPTCGNQNYNLPSLLNHVVQNARSSKKILESYEGKRVPKTIQRREKITERWEAWEAELLELIDKAAKWDAREKTT